MQFLDYVRFAREKKETSSSVPLAIVTNFTDDTLAKVLTGMCAYEGIAANIYQVPFKQYLFELKNKKSPLVSHNAALTFIFFDVNPYLVSEFSSDTGHGSEVIADIGVYAKHTKGTVIVQTLSEPSALQHGRLLRDSQLHTIVHDFNIALQKLSRTAKNVHVIDTGRLLRGFGETHARDMRGLYAFSQPFTNDFIVRVAREWMAYTRTIMGRVRKCLVLDLDNTLWGGVVGEVGTKGLQLGHEYPGNAFVAFQKAILELYERGIILAINSRNNEVDVDDVFKNNHHMVLKKTHFAAIRTNWESKADNIKSMAKELNIGIDSMVFIDDDGANRELVRAQLPEVLVPEWSMSPEMFAATLLELDAFHALTLTNEDRERGKMYAQERERTALLKTAQSPEDYIKSLGVEVLVSVNNPTLIARLAQLTQKTNQYNLTTHRSTEAEIERWIREGARVYAGDVNDKFGAYGTTIMAIVMPEKKGVAHLHTFLMSCRVMGRRVENAFIGAVLTDLRKCKFTSVRAAYIPTPKNPPIRDFLPSIGAKEVAKKKGLISYVISLGKSLKQTTVSSIKIRMVP